MNGADIRLCTDMPATKYILAHIKKCRLCHKHDRHVAYGKEYTPKELAVFAAHIRSVQAKIKLAIEDDEARARLGKL